MPQVECKICTAQRHSIALWYEFAQAMVVRYFIWINVPDSGTFCTCAKIPDGAVAGA